MKERNDVQLNRREKAGLVLFLFGLLILFACLVVWLKVL